VVDELNAALLGRLADDKLLRARKLRVDTTVVEADIDDPTDADLLERAVRKLRGLVRRVKAVVRPAGPGSAIAAGRPGGSAGSGRSLSTVPLLSTNHGSGHGRSSTAGMLKAAGGFVRASPGRG
jgi:hypothetical protein